MPRLFLDVPTESALLDEVTQRRQRLSAQRRTVLPQTALLAESYADAYPWMDASAIQSLVQAGVSPDAPQVQQVATLAAQQAAADGDFDVAADDVPDSWLESLGNAVKGLIAPVTRTGFTILMSPIEEFQALVSSAATAIFDETDPGESGLLFNDPLGNLASIIGDVADVPNLVSDFWTNYTEKAARSHGLIALSNIIDGKGSGLGEGFLPGGAVFEEREAAKHRLQIDGEFVTPGRLMARQFVEPGTFQWQMLSGLYDFAQNLVLDPVILPLVKLSKAQKATKAFQTTGVLSGLRKTVAPEVAVNYFLTHKSGQAVVRALTENADAYTAWKAIGKPNTGGADVARRLAATRSETETFDVLSDVLGLTVRERPNPRFVNRVTGRNDYGSRFGGGARVATADNSRLSVLGRMGRLGEDVPKWSVNIWDTDDAALQLDRWLINAQIPESARAARFTEMAALTPGDEVGMVDVLRKAMSDTEGVLVREWGVDPKRAREVTRMWENVSDDLRAWDLDDAGNYVDVLAPLRVNVGGKIVDLKPMPGMVSELANTIPLPDFREIRRLTPIIKHRWAQGFYDSKTFKVPVSFADDVMSVWKRLQLARIAYGVRVVGEGQVRIAGAGYDSLFSHPIDAIAWVVSIDPKSRLGRLLAKSAKKVIDPKGTQTISGKAWADITEHADSLNRGSAGWAGLPGEIVTGRYAKTRFGDPGFNEGWAKQFALQANDPVMRRVAGGLKEGDFRSFGGTPSGNNFDDVSEWFWKGTGQEWRTQLGRMPGRSELIRSRSAADAYLRQNYFDRLEKITKGNPDLVELVATGKLGGIRIRKPPKLAKKVNLRHSGSERKLSQVLEESYQASAPRYVTTQDRISVGRGSVDRLNSGLDHLLEAVMTNPENWLNRSATMRQIYFDRGVELIGFADAPTQKAIILGARKAGMDTNYLTRLAAKVVKGEGTKITSLADFEKLALSHAKVETKKLLYDLMKRNQFFDMMRIVFPFGEAWKEIVTSWAQIVRQNPAVVRRGQQALEGLRAPSVFGETETAPGTGEGFFAPDPSTGEEVFHYPGGAWVSKLLLGTDKSGFEFTGRAAGLNLATQTMIPGFGPVAQLPASLFLPNTPKWKDVREILLPFGETEGVGAAFRPAWFDKITKIFADPDPDKDRLFANTISDVQRALLRGGDYNMDTAEGQEELYDAAVTKARVIYAIRGIAQFSAPTGPALTWNTTDLAGNIVPVKILSDDLRTLTEEYGGNRHEAMTEWLRRYGVENVLAVIGKSTAILDRPVTEKGDAWLREHPEQERTFQMTVGLFAPEPAVGDFDYNAYLRAFETGAREPLSPAEQISLANDFLGRVQWEQAKKIADGRPGPTTSVWLADVRTQIAEAYPGFDGWVSRAIWEKRPKPDEMITELRAAVTDPVLAETDAGQGTLIYLSALAIADEMVTRLPGNTRHYQQAKSAEHIRDWLRLVSRQIIEEHPDFARMWRMVFERELADDVEVAA